MAVADLTDWMGEFGRPGAIWFAKRLSANDTLATDAHQAGPYIPKDFLFRVFPAINRPNAENPDCHFDLYIDSHSDHRTARAVWYNNRLRGGTRNETRLTGFGGRQSALLDPDSTGAIAVFAFVLGADDSASECHVWVSRNEVEEDTLEDRLGPIDPREHTTWEPGAIPERGLFAEEASAPRANCRLRPSEIPAEWIRKFPTGEEIILKTRELLPLSGTNIDARLVRRRICEFEIFQSVEEAVYLPRITAGFSSVEAFLGLAQTILQSRKSRSGNSLELHVRDIMKEEGLRPDTDFAHRPVIEGGKRPDFIFPSKDAYEDANFPAERLRLLAAKTTVKDRWRQIMNEADRIPSKHLVTLQEGVSEGQFREMRDARVQLVVPAGLHDAYPASVKPHLITLESFIADVRLLNLQKIQLSRLA